MKRLWHALRRQRGLSLVELAVVLAIVGVIGLLVWRWVAATRAPAQRPAMLAQLHQARAAVQGFVLAQHRLPCASADADGREACADATARRLPWRSLGLDSRFGTLHYGVHRTPGLDLAAAAPPLAAPDLNLDFDGVPQLPDFSPLPQLPPGYTAPQAATAQARDAADRARQAIAAARARRSQVNALDWCRVLRPFAADPHRPGLPWAGQGSDAMAPAFVIVHPGDNGQFDGHNAAGAGGPWRFDFPGRAQTSDFDDLALGIGPAELAASVGCAARLSEMQAAAQAAYAAYDNARVMQQYWSLRVFDIAQSHSALVSAQTDVALAAMGLAQATASIVISIASAANTEGVTAFLIIMAVVNEGVAIAQTVLAGLALKEAQDALQASLEKQKAANAYAAHIYDALAQAVQRAVQLDEKGLNP